MKEFPNTVVVLISDHGEEFLEHGFFGHGHSLYSEVVNVPLVIWAPDLEPQRVPWQVRSLDVFPTLVSLTGSASNSVIEALKGESLVEPIEGHRLAPLEVGGDERPPWHWRGLSDGKWKMVERLEVNPADHAIWKKDGIPVLDEKREAEGMPYFQIYDLENDPTEQTDLIKDELQRARSMKKVLEDNDWHYPSDWVNTFNSSRGKGGNLELMKQLGYLDPDDEG